MFPAKYISKSKWTSTLANLLSAAWSDFFALFSYQMFTFKFLNNHYKMIISVFIQNLLLLIIVFKLITRNTKNYITKIMLRWQAPTQPNQPTRPIQYNISKQLTRYCGGKWQIKFCWTWILDDTYNV